MNDKPEITTELLEKLMSWLNSTESFVVEQSPLIAQEMLAWGAAKGWFRLVLGILLFMIAITVMVVIFRKGEKWADDDNIPAFGLCVIGMFAIIPAIVLTYDSTLLLIKIHVAPRVYLLEQIQQLLN